MRRSKLFSLTLAVVFILQSVIISNVLGAEDRSVVEEAPAALLSLTALTITDSSAELVWTSGQNSPNAATYEIFRDDILITNTASFAYTDTNLTPETSYKYIVKAKNTDGNIIAGSNPLDITTLAEPEPSPSEPEFTEAIIDAGQLRQIDPEFETDRYIIKFKNGKSAGRLNGVLEGIKGASLKSEKSHGNIGVVSFENKRKVKDVADELKQAGLDSDIEYIQPDYEFSLSSNDPYYSSQWGLENNPAEAGALKNLSMQERVGMLPPHLKNVIEDSPEFMEFLMNTPIEELRDHLIAGDVPGDVPLLIPFELAHERAFVDTGAPVPDQPAYLCDAGVVGAWEGTTGSAVEFPENTTASGITVAIIDTGIDIAHEDLAENIWVNAGEIPGNGVDDDGNGCIDDVNGWNFSENSNEVYDYLTPADESHGTQIAGIISAAKDNGIGIAGVAPFVKVLPLKAFKDGKAYTSDIIGAIKYAESMGVKIVNCSWESASDNPAMKEVIQESDMLFVTAAGNSGADIDANPVYPASFDCPNIITVASVNRYGRLSDFSNFGVHSVDVAAPGEEIRSTLPGDAYEEGSGTSMAAAFVSGEAGLLLAVEPNADAAELKADIISYSDRLSSLVGNVYEGRKINCTNSINKVGGDGIIQVPEGISMRGSSAGQGTGEIRLDSAPPVEGQFLQVAGGEFHSLALKDDGTVWAWGDNSCGQLGDGTETSSNIPVQVYGLTNIIAVAAGAAHSLALQDDGTVWAWGWNNYSQLGDGTTTYSTMPVQVTDLSGVTAISAGYYHSLALKEDGTVWVWGVSNYASHPLETQCYAVIKEELEGVTAIAAGDFHSLALKEDGTVWAWGLNGYSQLGDGSTTNSNVPWQVADLDGVCGIAAGTYHSLALKEDGTVWAWGDNSYGQLGDGTTEPRSTPVQTNVSGGISITAGGYHSLALKSDGTVWAWGYNYYGQLGDGTAIDRSMAIQVDGLTGTIAIAGGGCHSLAVKNDGTVWAWGRNDYGQLGNGEEGYTEYPYAQWVCGTPNTYFIVPANIKATAAESSVSLSWDAVAGATGYDVEANGVVIDNGTSLTYVNVNLQPNTIHSYRVRWKDNFGLAKWSDAITVNTLASIPTNGASSSVNSSSISATWEANGNPDGTLYSLAAFSINDVLIKQNSWTNALEDTIIDLAANTEHRIKIKAKNNEDKETEWYEIGSVTPFTEGQFLKVAAGGSHSLALMEYGTVWSWGDNHNGQLGDGTFISNRTATMRVGGLSTITSISGGGGHNLALKEDGTVWTWGWNAYGQVGNGTTTNELAAEQIRELNNITAIAGGDYHSLALKNDGTVWTWGLNNYGQLGDGTTTNRSKPVQVSGLSGVIAIAGEYYHSLALKNDGTVWAWGANDGGQLGDGTTTQRSTPVQVSGLSEIIAIAGGYHSLALKNDGTVWAWGLNNYGQLGDGTTISRNMAIQVSGLNNVYAIAGGDVYSLALKEDGTVWAWGSNSYGQLGDGTRTNRSTAVQIIGLNGVTDISGGGYHSLAIKNDGTVWAWGDNYAGQLGSGGNRYCEYPKWVCGTPDVYLVPPANIMATAEKRSISLSWDAVAGATGYDVEADGAVINNVTSLAYIHENLQPGTAHSYRVRWKDNNGVGKWSRVKKVYTLPGTYSVQCYIGKTIDFVVKLENAIDISSHTFVVRYNPADLDVIDLCSMTYFNETASGAIQGTDITILEHTAGTIKFTFDKTLEADRNWSGIVNIIRFGSKKDTGQTNIEYLKI